MSLLTASVDLRPEPRSVPSARHLVASLLAGWGARQSRADVALLVTELVANVVDHVEGDSVLTLELALSDDALRISVADGSAVRPVVREIRTDSPRGPTPMITIDQAPGRRWTPPAPAS